MSEQQYFNLKELAEKANVPLRRIRYFIQTGLIPRPKGGGRAYFYTEDHLSKIQAIKDFISRGMPLKEIKKKHSEGILPPLLGFVGAAIGGLGTQRWIKVKIGSQLKKVRFKPVVRTKRTTPK